MMDTKYDISAHSACHDAIRNAHGESNHYLIIAKSFLALFSSLFAFAMASFFDDSHEFTISLYLLIADLQEIFLMVDTQTHS